MYFFAVLCTPPPASPPLLPLLIQLFLCSLFFRSLFCFLSAVWLISSAMPPLSSSSAFLNSFCSRRFTLFPWSRSPANSLPNVLFPSRPFPHPTKETPSMKPYSKKIVFIIPFPPLFLDVPQEGNFGNPFGAAIRAARNAVSSQVTETKGLDLRITKKYSPCIHELKETFEEAKDTRLFK